LEKLTLYGYTGTNYTVETATNLNAPVAWQPAFLLTPTNFIAVPPEFGLTNAARFYRAKSQ
jgi:hypothetical protein